MPPRIAAVSRGAGSSIAVIGTGPDRVYPARNRDLAHELAARGLVVSEFAVGTPPQKQNFPRRNRLVSGLSRGVLVVEATLSSGSLITARLAGEQGREVFALAGLDPFPVLEGRAQADSRGREARRDRAGHPRRTRCRRHRADAVAPNAGTEPDAAMRAVLRALGHDPADVDTLAARTALSIAATVGALTALELEQQVAPLPGGLWQRLG